MMIELPHTPRPGRHRQVVRAFITVTLLVASWTPASYYAKGETYDERFAWRMFSGKRAEQCRVQVVERRLVGERTEAVKLPLSRVIHKAWESGLKRLRPDIVESFFEKRCVDPAVQSLELTRQCRRADGAPKPNDTTSHACPIRLVIP